MIIRSLHLENYRCFENIDIDFDDQLTVLVGTNGSGKTAVLDALGVFLQQAGHPRYFEEAFYQISMDDVAIGKTSKDIKYSIGIQSRNVQNGEIAIFDFINDARDTTGTGLRIPPENIPLLRAHGGGNVLCVAYMAGRFVRGEDSILKNTAYTPSAYSAYEKNFDRSIDYISTISWFNSADSDEARDMRDNEHKNQMPELKAVREALTKALQGEYERPRMFGNPPEMIINRKGTEVTYKVSQLSDGYRAMLALVMDLARRMAEVRKHDNRDEVPESLLHAPAIVLIDEVELHLHPSWQQTILNTLMEIFPNTQFIVTTHSPQVLSSIPDKHIRILSEGKAYTVNEQTQGVMASQILKQVFDVDPRPKGLEIVRILYEYTKLVYDEEWDTPAAEELRKKLDEHFGDSEPELMILDMHIDNSKWERGL